MNKKKVTIDIGLNIIASSLPTLALQLLIFPLIAASVSEDDYGLILTIVGIVNVVAGVIGSSLNNTRLIHNEKYVTKELRGDFNFLVVIGLLLTLVLMPVILFIYLDLDNPFSLALLSLTVVFSLLALYNSVSFRIELNYFRILFNSFALIVGYGVGFLLFMIYGQWELIFFFGYLSSLLYIFFNSRLWKEPFVRTPLLGQTLKYILFLAFANLLANALIYIDRFLLYPFLGGAVVAVFYVSSLFGKVISMAITPMTGVILSYVAKMEKITRKAIAYILLFSLGIGSLGYLGCVVICPTILRFLYPTMAEEAMQFFYINTLTAILGAVSAVLNPIIMKFRNISWQLTIGVANLVVYISLSLPLLNFFGLMGFCVGALIAAVIKLLIAMTVGLMRLKA